MEAIKNVIFTACLCAVLTSAVQTLSPERMKTELRLVCGLILIICAASQISGTRIALDDAPGLLTDNAEYSDLLTEFENAVTDESRAALEKTLLEKLVEQGISAQKVVIVCSLDEYNYVKADKACIYLSEQADDEQKSDAESAARALLPETEIEVITDVG